MCDFVKGLFTKEWTLDDKVLCISVAALMGVVAGFLLSPIKSGVSVFSGNGCNNSGNKSVSSISKGDCAKKKGKKEEAKVEENSEEK